MEKEIGKSALLFLYLTGWEERRLVCGDQLVLDGGR